MVYIVSMRHQDTRTLSPAGQEAVRFRVVAAIRNGMRKSEAARVFGVSRTSIDTWLAKVASTNINALKSKKRGRKPGSRLKGHEAANIVRTITDRCPDQLKMPFVLWTRPAVQQLLVDRLGVSVSLSTVGRYLKHWGFTPQKPLRRAYERDPVAVRRWLECEYPSIQRRAKAENAEIHWGDQMGLRSDHQVGTSYSRRGCTPVVRCTGKRFGCNMMSSITNHGTLRFMVFKRRFTSEVMVAFCRRLLRTVGQKVYLILDRHPVHRSRVVQEWLSRHRARIELFLLPGYSPELNPDELLNQDVKSNGVGRRRPATREELIDNVRSYLRGTQRQPEIVRNYFQGKHVTYAA